VLPSRKTASAAIHGGSDLAQSRFLTHALVLLIAAIVPALAAITRDASGAGYSVGYAAQTLPVHHPTAGEVTEVPVTAGGLIMRVSLPLADAPPRRDIFYYTLKPGDTVENVAGQFGLTANTLRWANQVTSVTTLRPGMRLIVPPVNGVLVRVGPGMTLASLALRYGVDPQGIIDFNYLRDPDHLQPGSMLMLPDGRGPPLADPQKRPSVVRRSAGVAQPPMKYVGTVRGSNGRFPYGYCTWWVAQKRSIPWTGDAWQWWYNARLFGAAEGQTPRPGAIMVAGISFTSPVGHVAYVESVNSDGSFVVSEMNWGRWGVVDFRTLRPGDVVDLLGFIY
jgi:surface antigen/LysM repeat protein